MDKRMRVPATAHVVGFVLVWAAAASGQGATGEAAREAAGSAGRPNILFCIADDWGYPHAGAYGDQVVQTPTFDRLAEQGVLFTSAFCTTPSCTASRGAILTGQTPHRLAEGANLWSTLPARFGVYPDLLEAGGYVVGCTGKGWGPGDHEAGGRSRNPAGPSFKSFDAFLQTVPKDRPFCFWFGSFNPHRPYEKGSGKASGMKMRDVIVPPFLPDTPEVRGDMLDYYLEVQRFDAEVGAVLRRLDASGRANNTVVVMTSDNGMPFPRAKTNLYDAGTRLPLSIRWPAGAKGGRRLNTLVSFTDFAPTFVELAGLSIPSDMTGRSLLPVLAGKTSVHRASVFFDRERHGNGRPNGGGYPSRGVRTAEFLFILNLRPDRWPAGDPAIDVGGKLVTFGDMDVSPTKELLMGRRDEAGIRRFFELAMAKRPAEELYDLAADPHALNNVATDAAYADEKRRLRGELARWMAETADPRASGDDDRWDRYPYLRTVPPKKTTRPG